MIYHERYMYLFSSKWYRKGLKQLLISKINSATMVYHHNPHLTRIKQRRAAQNCCSRSLMLPLAILPLLSASQSSNDSPNRSNNFIPHDHGLLSCHRPPNGDLIAPLLSYSVLIFCSLLTLKTIFLKSKRSSLVQVGVDL